MSIKNEKGLAGIDIAISIVIITVFIAMITNLIVLINLNNENAKRKTIATSYAVQEIEKRKAQGFTTSYNDKGTSQEDVIEESDIKDSTGNFTGYHKKVSVKDYVLIKNDNTKQKNLVKEIIVTITYRLGNKDQNVSISTYITKL